MNLCFNAYSPRINEWGDDEVTIWIIKIGQSVDIEQNNDEITSDHKDNDMRNVEDGDEQDAKVHEQQEEGHKVEEKSLMGMEEAFEKLKKFVLQTNVSDMDEKEKLSENDSCGDMELHVSPIVNNQCHDEKIFAYYEDLVFTNTLESLVVAYVFDVSLDKSELVNFQYEHANQADFLTLGPRQELLDVIINLFACKLNSFENKFKGIWPTRCYLPTTFAIYIPMHDTCPDHWYLCVINLHQYNIHILDSLPSIERNDMRTSSVRTMVLCTFFNLNGHVKNLSSVPIERPTWVDVQANGWDCGVHVINHMRRSDFMDSSSTLPIGTLQL
ncbi:hypothetical protein AAG906_006756 [Vitis piasezkii]